MSRTGDEPPSSEQPSASEDEAPPLDDLVRRYLDLYQESWARSLADPRLVEAWLGLARPFVEAWRDAASTIRPTHGAETSSASPSGGADDVGELSRRVAALERRIDELERVGRTDGAGAGEVGRGGARSRPSRAPGGTAGRGRKGPRS